jgi:sRNA-binding regulator protein Hfq
MPKQQTLREQYLAHLRNKGVTAISSNGFQLKGELTQFDCSDLALSTTQYDQRPKETLCSNFIAVIPQTHQHKNARYCKMKSVVPTLREQYLQKLLLRYISCIALNGFLLKGTLVAFDEQDVIISTTQYGSFKHVLVTCFSSIIPEE